MALPASLKYFNIFNLKPSFTIDQGDLKTKYFELSKRYHPDKMVNAPADGMSIEEINKAYITLGNDFLRAKYLHGSEGMPKIDREFLADMLDYEESISNINSDEEEERIRRDLEERITQCKLNFFDKEYLCKWAYYERLRDILNKRKDLRE